jgi:hypothetical protein
MNRIALVVAVCTTSACLDTQLPPLPGPGAIQGTLLATVPGTPTPAPVARGTVALVESGLLVETSADGRFELTPVPRAEGTLVFSGNGLRRVLTLDGLRAGPGRTTALGNVVLGANASVLGAVQLEDSSDLAGTLAFAEGELVSAFTTPRGEVLLRDLPSGPLRIAFVRAGYVPSTQLIELQSGQRFSLEPVTLRRLPAGLSGVRVVGQALLSDSADATGISVSIEGVPSASTGATGDYAFAAVPIGAVSVRFEKAGYRSVVLQNRLVGTGPLTLPTVTLVPGMSTASVVPWNPRYDAGPPEPGADAGFDAGTPTDAGLDAGADAGSSVDAGLDGGADAGALLDAGMDAGSSLDAGMDAGSPLDAGADAGLSTDAGSDAGPPLILPQAVIGPLPARVLFSTQPFQLDGLSSTGFPALSRYVWTVDTGLARLPDGGAVTLSPNDSGVAWAPTMRLPAPPALVSLTLQVTDLSGRVSAPATAGFVVGDRPLALFDAGSLPTQLYSQQTVTIDATPSRDPMNSGIASRRWELSAGAPVTTSALDGGDTLTLTTLTVPATQMVTVSHWVTNGLGFESLARQHTFSVIAGPVPQPNPWAVFTVNALIVDAGTFIPLVATLDAGGNGPFYADPSNYSFSWVSLSDAGTPPQWTIGDPAARSTSVFLPAIDGPPQRYDFQVTATTRPPLLAGSTSAPLSILAQDRRPPRITALSTGATGSTLGVFFDFSEPMDVGPGTCLMAVNNGNCAVLNTLNGVGRTVGKLNRGNRVLYITRPPFPGEVRSVRLQSQVDDVVGNPVVPSGPAVLQDFLAEARWTPLVLAFTGTDTVEPRPGVTLTSAQLTEHLARVFGSDGTQARSVQTGVLSACATPPCPTTSATVGSAASTAPVRPSAFSSGGFTAYQSAPGVVFLVDGGAMPLAPGPVFPDGRGGLSTVYLSGDGVRMADFVDGGWDLANALPVQDGGVPVGSTLSAAAVGTTLREFCVARRSGNAVRVLTRSGSGAFGQPLYNNPSLSGYAAKDAFVYSLSPTTCHVAFMGMNDQPAFIQASPGDFGSTGNIQYPASPPLASFDVAIDPHPSGVVFRWWALVDQSGQLNLHYTAGVQDLTLATRLPPPGGAASLNADPSCVAAHPRLVPFEQAVYVVWQEQCAGQPWRVYLRGLQ